MPVNDYWYFTLSLATEADKKMFAMLMIADATCAVVQAPRELGCHDTNGTGCISLDGVPFGSTLGCSASSHEFCFDNAETANGKRPCASFFAAVGVLALGLALLWPMGVSAQTVANPYDYSRIKSFTYDADGRVSTETVEPDRIAHCVISTYGYAPTGQQSSNTQTNCAGAVAPVAFPSRTTSQKFDAVVGQQIVVAGSPTPVNVPVGVLNTSSTDGLNRQKSFTYDPRSGALLSVTGVDGLVTRYEVDDFGRRTKTTNPDGTHERIAYCFLAPADTSSNSALCGTPAASEVPGDAVWFTETTTFSPSGPASGPAVRAFIDKRGRTIRTTTRSFDDPSQPLSFRAVAVAKDVVFDVVGNKSLETQPYFLSTGSSETIGANDVGVVRYTYDALGRLSATYAADPKGSIPHSFGGDGPVSYGNYGVRSAARYQKTYDGLVVIDTNALSQQTITEYDALGQPLRITDPAGAQLAHLRDAFGNVTKSRDALGNEVTSTYDYLGRRTQLSDPDKGVWTYTYDALGQLLVQQSPKQRAQVPAQRTDLEYDMVGRLTKRTDEDAVRTWIFDCDGNVGRLCQATTSTGVTRTLRYDSAGRVSSTRLDVGGGNMPATESFATSVTYDTATGRVATQTYPTGLTVRYRYTGLGNLKDLRLVPSATIAPLPTSQGITASGGSYLAETVLWQALIANARGATTNAQLANSVATTTRFESPTNRIVAVAAGTDGQYNVLDQSFGWDALGNLTSRGNDLDGSGGTVTETFRYGDAGSGPNDINRLTQYTVAGPSIPGLFRSVSLSYNALGSLLVRSDVGNYAYGAAGGARPHALLAVNGSVAAQYDANGNLISSVWGKYSSVAYTAGDYVKAASGIGATGPAYAWHYDENDWRLLEVRTIPSGTAAGTRKVWYLPADNAGALAFEREINEPGSPSSTNPQVSSNRHYLSANGETIGVLVSTGALPALAVGQTAPAQVSSVALNKVEFWHKDHLGSVASTTDHTGTVTARYSYDPFGQRRFPSGAFDAIQTLAVDWNGGLADGTARGFTGHEHLDDIGLVNMNGRIYDAALGTFIQADTHVQYPQNLQSYNRYAYLLNNPLNATDPTGFDRWGGNPQTGSASSGDIFTDFLGFGYFTSLPNGTLFLANGELASRWQASVDTFASLGVTELGADAANGARTFFGDIRLGYRSESVLDLPTGKTGLGYGWRFGQWARGLSLTDIPFAGDLYGMGKGVLTGDGSLYFASSLALGINLLSPGRGKLAATELELAASGTTPLFRAVGPAELADIKATDALRNLGSAEGKYFTTSAAEASAYAKQAVKAFGDQPYTIIRTDVPNSIFKGLSPATVDRGIPAWVIPTDRLPGLVPRVMDHSPLPPVRF